MIRGAGADPVLRVVLAALAGTIAGIHFDLWNSYGYRHIPHIGPLFLLDAAAGVALAVASLVLPARLVALAWLGVAGYGAATLAAVLVSLGSGLLGFSETTSAPLLAPAIAAEAAAFVIGAGAALRARHRTRLRS